MAKHNETGLKGEQLAKNFLLKKGFSILHEGWRCGHKEIDLIAIQERTLVFVEVKTRSSLRMGYPEEAIGTAKRQFLKMAAEVFLLDHPEYTEARFDVISILMSGAGAAEIRHLENVLL